MEMYEAVGDRNITVGFRTTPNNSVAVCNIDRFPDYWWVSRVFVRNKYRRQQLGSRCLERAIEIASNLDGPDSVVVAPGGYNTPYDVQCAFYAAHGFSGCGIMQRHV